MSGLVLAIRRAAQAKLPDREEGEEKAPELPSRLSMALDEFSKATDAKTREQAFRAAFEAMNSEKS